MTQVVMPLLWTLPQNNIKIAWTRVIVIRLIGLDGDVLQIAAFILMILLNIAQ